MLRLGVPLSEKKICQPFGLTQRRGLDQFGKLEPELWEKLVNRVSGANFGSIYSKTSLLGYLKTQKPNHFNGLLQKEFSNGCRRYRGRSKQKRMVELMNDFGIIGKELLEL